MFAGLVLGARWCLRSRRPAAASGAFVLDSRIELRKVVWPTRQETIMTTVVVFVFVTLAGFFFWVLDLLLAGPRKLLTGQGS